MAKHVFNTWLEKSVLTLETLEQLNKQQDKIKVPSDIGRISHVGKHYKTLKADEWKHWVLIYSMYCLRGLLPVRDLNIWSMFVNACHLLCRPIVAFVDIEQAQNLLKIFCVQFEQRYGGDFVVPNMHMMLHIVDCMKMFGPVYSFWCFGFERYVC